MSFLSKGFQQALQGVQELGFYCQASTKPWVTVITISIQIYKTKQIKQKSFPYFLLKQQGILHINFKISSTSLKKQKMKQQKSCIAQRATSNKKSLIPSTPKRSDIPLTPTLSNRSVSLGSRNSTRQLHSDLALFGNEAGHRKTQYFVDTENEMEEQRRKDLQGYEMATFQQILTYSKNKRVKALCYIFINKLKRSKLLPLISYNYYWEDKLGQQRVDSLSEGQVPLSLLCEIGYILTLLLVFVYYSLCLGFSTVLINTFFSISTVFLAFFSFIKLCLTFHYYFKIPKLKLAELLVMKSFIYQITLPLFLFIFTIVLLALNIAHRTQEIQYITPLLLIMIYYQINRLISQVLVSIASWGRTYILISRIDLIVYVLKNLLWIHIFAVILSRLISQRPEINWVNTQEQTQYFKFFIYIRSLYQGIFVGYLAISIILTASFHFPSPYNSLQTFVFIPVRITAFLISFNNLQVIVKKVMPLLTNKHPQPLFNHNLDVQRIVQKYTSDRIKYIETNELLQILKNQRLSKSESQTKNKQSTIYDEYKKEIDMRAILSNSIIVLSGLSATLCRQLAQKCHLQIVATDTIINSFNFTSDWLILAKGKISAVSLPNRALFSANYVDSKLAKSPILLSCHLLSRKVPNWRLRCNTTSLIYKIQDEEFRKAIKMNEFDHQLVWSQHDKHCFKDEFSLFQCSHCQEQHSEFQCPKLHYTPFTTTIITKQRRPIIFFLKRFKGHESRLLRIKSSALKFYAPFQQLLPQIKQKLFQYCNASIFFQLMLSHRLQEKPNYIQSTVVEKAAQKMLGLFKVNTEDYQDEIWQLKTDELHNYKYYFPRHNPSKLTNKFLN